MSAIRFVLFKKRGMARWDGKSRQISPNTLLVTSGNVKVYGEDLSDFYCSTEELTGISTLLNTTLQDASVVEKLRSTTPNQSDFEVLMVTEEAEKAVKSFETPVDSSLSAFTIFCYLFIDWDYFSAFLKQWKNDINGLFTFIPLMSLYACKPWPASRYAQATGLSVRKFNTLFYEKFGVSAKHWLRHKRLIRAGELLAFTSLQIADIAEVCGFNNHAYFSARFKKQFSCTPRKWRVLATEKIVANDTIFSF